MNNIEELKNLLIEISKGLVDEKDAVKVEVKEQKDEQNGGKINVYHLEVSVNDKGRVIGKQGRIAKAIRIIMRAAANHVGERILVEII